VQGHGCHVWLPNGQRLLIDVDCRIHLHDGNATLPMFHGVTLHLIDGSALEMVPGDRDRGFSAVRVLCGIQEKVLWSGRRRNAQATPPNHLVVLGDGTSLYRAGAWPPVLFLDKLLGPAGDRFPVTRLLVLGDWIRESCAWLPALAPRRSVQFAEAGPRADDLANWSNGTFTTEPQRATPLPAGVGGLASELIPGLWLRAREWSNNEHWRLELVQEGGATAEQSTPDVLPDVLAVWTSGPGSPRLLQPRSGRVQTPWRAQWVHRGVATTALAQAVGSWCPWPASTDLRVTARRWLLGPAR
jgi:hypothetical protein